MMMKKIAVTLALLGSLTAVGGVARAESAPASVETQQISDGLKAKLHEARYFHQLDQEIWEKIEEQRFVNRAILKQILGDKWDHASDAVRERRSDLREDLTAARALHAEILETEARLEEAREAKDRGAVARLLVKLDNLRETAWKVAMEIQDDAADMHRLAERIKEGAVDLRHDLEPVRVLYEQQEALIERLAVQRDLIKAARGQVEEALSSGDEGAASEALRDVVREEKEALVLEVVLLERLRETYRILQDLR